MEIKTIKDLSSLIEKNPSLFEDDNAFTRELYMLLYGNYFTFNGKVIPIKYWDIIFNYLKEL